MTGTAREKVFAFVCTYFDKHGYSPTLNEIGVHFGFSSVAAWKHVKTLIEQGRLRRSRERDRYITIPGKIDLRPIPTDALVTELARRRAVSHAETSR
jgi:SOS-response transcriptional repressor LexA